MARYSRRSALRTVAAGVAALGAGCVTSPGSDQSTTAATTTTATSGTPTPTTESFPPDVDERVDEEPPGSPALESEGAWPAYRFDAGNTGANPDGRGLRDGTRYWRLDAGGPATVAGGTLYNTGAGDGARSALTYRDPATAAVETTSPLVEYGVNPPPAVADGRVFVTTFIEAFCFDAGTGERLWRGPEMDGIQGCPTVHDGTVLVNSGGYDDVGPHLRAFDAATGEQLWRYDTGHETKSTPAVGDGTAFVVSTAGLHAVDLASGEQRYVVEEAANRWATPVFRDGTVYATAASDGSDELLAVDAGDGTVNWRTAVEADGPPVVTDETVYTVTGDGVVALDADDGTVVASDRMAFQPVALVGDVLYATHEGRVVALDAADDLASLWSLTTESVQVSDTVGRNVYHVTPVDGAVYVSARDAFHGVGPAEEG